MGVYRHYLKPGSGGHTEASWELETLGHIGIPKLKACNTIPGGVMHQDSITAYWVAYDNPGRKN